MSIVRVWEDIYDMYTERTKYVVCTVIFLVDFVRVGFVETYWCLWKKSQEFRILGICGYLSAFQTSTGTHVCS